MNKIEHLLVCLNEEGLEICKAADKALRFGLDARHGIIGSSNEEDLVQEINDLIGVVEVLKEQGVILVGLFDRAVIDAKKAKVLKYME